jgi:hypothetical protein
MGEKGGAATVVSALNTTELRWFLPGPLPEEVRRWFTGVHGVVEERRDTYLLVGRPDRGVKYRGGETLELKVRQRVNPRIELGDGLGGPPEEWRKWSPAESFFHASSIQRRVDVEKVIVKRRFSPEGTEEVFSPQQYVGCACDIEVADVRLCGVAAWTFALAGFGPPATRSALLVECWEGLKATSPGTIPPELAAGHAMSYPERLSRVVHEPPAELPGTSGDEEGDP